MAAELRAATSLGVNLHVLQCIAREILVLSLYMKSSFLNINEMNMPVTIKWNCVVCHHIRSYFVHASSEDSDQPAH